MNTTKKKNLQKQSKSKLRFISFRRVYEKARIENKRSLKDETYI